MDYFGKRLNGWAVGLALFLCGPAAFAQQEDADAREPVHVEHQGELLEGEFFDRYELAVKPGDHLIVNLRAADFDTYLSVVAPDGTVSDNDDWNQTNKHSHVHLIAEVGGVYEIRVAAFSIDQIGPYKLDLFTGAESPDGSMPPIIEHGDLAEGDKQVPGAPGRYIDRFPLDGEAGQHLIIELNSYDFDTFLILESQDGSQRWENDDFRERQDMSYLSITLPTAGQYTISVTSYEANEVGEYDLMVRRGSPPPSPINLRTDRHDGELAAGDEQRKGGEFADVYPFEGLAGEQITIDLLSTAFDTFLVMEQVGGEKKRWENDDILAGNTNHSQLIVTLPADGTYIVYATSYEAAEAGKYQCTIGHVAPRTGKMIEGDLAAGDATRERGEFIDWIDLPTEPGQAVEVRLTSTEFDPYLIVETPAGERYVNDDYEGQSDESRVSMRIRQPGTHRIGVSSFEPGHTGSYQIDVLILPAPDPASLRVVQELAAGDSVLGELAYGDATLDNGELADRYLFNATTGQQIVIDLKSNDFDTFLKLIEPNGNEIVNDDFDGQSHSRITLTAQQSGRYRLAAAAYEADTIGSYTLSLQMPQPADSPLPEIPARRVFGLFIGISDYGGENDLPFCAKDATSLHRKLRDQFSMRAEDSIILTDQKATIQNVETAIKTIVEQASADDTVILFYSGHGGQQARELFNAQDPDAKDETICLVDGDMTDDHFAQLLTDLRAGTTLVMLDACYSGGFAKDVISTPGRMGLFSSEEDVLSMVAERFEAGGYLSLFVGEAMGDKRDQADLNKDKLLTSHELCYYVNKRYSEVVRQPKPLALHVEGPEVSPDSNLSFQKLVTDRGGVSPNHALLSWE